MRTLLADARYGVRVLAHTPVLTAAAVLSLALGIGANLTVFGLIHSTLLRPLPVREPKQLVFIHHNSASFSHPAYAEFRALGDLFEGVAAYSAMPGVVISTPEFSERTGAEVTSSEYAAVTGLRMELGRWPAGDESGVVIGEALWKRRFGGNPGVIGQAVRINGQPFSVMGVAAAGFSGMEPGVRTELWAPLAAHAAVMPWGMNASAEQVRKARFESRGTEWLNVVARLKWGVSIQQADAAVRAVAARAEKPRRQAGVTSAASGALHPDLRRDIIGRMRIFLAVAVLVLISACANVANLLLARTGARRNEIAVRLAVGAGRFRMIRQFLTESVLLGLMGGTAAVLAAMWAPSLLGSMRLPGGWAARDLNLTPDRTVYLFALGLSMAAGIACGIAPALRGTAPDIGATLRESGSGRASRGRLRAALVVAQVGVSALLLVSAGLLVRSLYNRFTLDPGFREQNLLLVSFEAGMDKSRGGAFYGELASRARQLPGVQSAALSALPPLDPRRIRWGGSLVEGAKADLNGNAVTPGYFETMGIPVVDGRGFSASDAAAASPLAVINERMARRFWPGRSAIGAQFTAGGERYTVIGVARDSRHYDVRTLLEAPGPFVYVNAAQQYWPRMTLLLRTSAPPAAVLATLDRELRGMNSDIAPITARTARAHVNEVFAEERTAALLSAALGLIALVLSVAGIYGVVSFWVTERTHEIGIRMALGAKQRDALGLVLRRAAALAGAGVILGLAGAAAGTRALAGMLFGVTARDPAVFGAAAAILLAVALAAAYLPARRAARVDPIVALHYE